MLYLETSVVEKALGQLEPFGPIQQPYPFPLCHYLLALDIRLSPPVQAHNLEALLAVVGIHAAQSLARTIKSVMRRGGHCEPPQGCPAKATRILSARSD